MSQGFSFGSTAAAAPAPSGGFSFGSTPAPAPSGGGFSFGTPAPAPAYSMGTSGFGTPAPAAPAPASGGFSSFSGFTPAPAPGTSSLFGAPSPGAGGSSLFGAPAAAPSTSLFGAPAPASYGQAPPGATTSAVPGLAGHLPYSALPADQKMAIDRLYQSMMQHKRAVLQTSSMAPKMLSKPQQADIAGGTQELPLESNVIKLTSQVEQLQDQINALRHGVEYTQTLYESSTSQAFMFAQWPTEAVAARRGVPLEKPRNTMDKEMQIKLRQILDKEMAHVDRVERMPSPYLWQVLEQMEQRLFQFQGQMESLKQALQNSKKVNSEDVNLLNILRVQDRAIWQIATALANAHGHVDQLRANYRHYEKGTNVLDAADQEERQRQLYLDHKLSEQMVKSMPSASARPGAPPAPSSTLFGSGPAPSTSGLFGAPAPSGGLFGAPAPSGGLFGAPAPAPSGGLFGAPAPAPSGGLFGAPAPAPTGGLFGTPAPSSGGFGLGTTPASAPSGGLFGSTPAPAPSTGLFGATTPSPAPVGGGLFGSTTQAPAPFGGAAPTPAGGGGFSFGGASATAPAPAFGGFGSGASSQSSTTSTPKAKNKSRSTRRR